MHFINQCTWKSSQYYIIIRMMTSLVRMSQKLVFHQSKCICAIKRILSTTAMYVSSSSFMYLRFPCYCDACLNSSTLRVGLKTLLNTIISWFQVRICAVPPQHFAQWNLIFANSQNSEINSKKSLNCFGRSWTLLSMSYSQGSVANLEKGSKSWKSSKSRSCLI